MFKGWKLASVVLLLAFVSACNLPGGPVIAGGTGPVPISMSDTPNQIPLAATDTSGPTLTASLTRFSTETSPAPHPLISVSKDTNCRSGPGQVYDYLGGLMVGETSEVYAKDPTGRYWYISNLDGPGYCWVWGEYATVTGDTGFLPVYTPEPTPTLTPTLTPETTQTYTPTLPPPAVAAFTASYISKSHCGAFYILKIKLSNTGSITWKSISISVNDLSLNISVPVSRNGFPVYTGCTASANADLTPGEEAVTASGNLSSDPTGHSLMIYIKICSQVGLAGTCINKSISFAP
jgi:hypothetical protein